MKYVLLAGLLLALPAAAQPEQPVPGASTPVQDVLAVSPQMTISNGLITARIVPPDPARGFYRGTRFDQAGVITSLTFKGRNFYGPWFDRVAPEVLDYWYDRFLKLGQSRHVRNQDHLNNAHAPSIRYRSSLNQR